jgi:hypothetical protein
MREIFFRGILTPAQWLPKPATSQFPEEGRSLRELWSPEERKSDSTLPDCIDVPVAAP